MILVWLIVTFLLTAAVAAIFLWVMYRIGYDAGRHDEQMRWERSMFGQKKSGEAG